MTPRAVFDCMVFLQGAGRPQGPARACFRLVDEGKVLLGISPDILAEVRDVLARPETRRKFPLLRPEWVEEFVQGLENKAVAISMVPSIYALDRDPKDEPYVNLAIAIGAQFLVSRDKDLLDLMSDQDFRDRFPALTILDPAAFLRAIADRTEVLRPECPKPS
jgi:putative PIN family toxin of toxin-antitoxin system